MLKRSLIAATAMTAGALCSAQAEAGRATQFVQFAKSCDSGTVCSMDVPLPSGTRGTYIMPTVSCSWNGNPVTRADIVVYLKSNRAQQFIIPKILSDAEQAASVFILSPLDYQIIELRIAYGVAVNLYLDASSQTTVNCYAAF